MAKSFYEAKYPKNKRPSLDLSRVKPLPPRSEPIPVPVVVKTPPVVPNLRVNNGYGSEPTVTMQERKAIAEFIRTWRKNSAIKSIAPHLTNKKTITTYANQLFRRPEVQKELRHLMEEAGLSDDYLARKIREMTEVGWGEGAKHKDAMKGMEMVLKMRGWLDNRSTHTRINVRTNLGNMPYPTLVSEYEKMKKRTDALLAEVQEGEIVSSSPSPDSDPVPS